MKLVTIDQPNHDILRTPAQRVSFPLSDEIKNIIAQMKQFILKDLEGDASGLAAPQVNHPWQIVYIEVPEEARAYRKDAEELMPLTILMNPAYEPIPEAGKSKDWEACFSVPGKMGEVYRYNAIQCRWFDETGKKHARIARGFLARVFQHEVGHLNAEVYVDLIEADCRFGTMEEMMALRKKETK